MQILVQALRFENFDCNILSAIRPLEPEHHQDDQFLSMNCFEIFPTLFNRVFPSNSMTIEKLYYTVCKATHRMT
jgi:hypothetical protein